ncbi:hypothetical protein B7P43_G01051 [Cryptotermes secundus]|uniref:Short/branched chain specific acyl-CoA dehydrogenase, mitochondrial n=1 Tax=Cryptotermes secundus TaxID=105785 RepID=A0A2J7PCT2_9NEOP|nr:hypothetical protein B7P43_G01051 [Cryptotermes secundus]
MLSIRNIFKLVQKGIGHVKGNNLHLSNTLLCQQRTLSHAAPGSPASLYFFTEEEKMMKETVSRLAEEKISPLVKKMEQDSKFDSSVVDALFKNGLMGIDVETEYGGSGLSFFASVLAVEEVAKVDPSLSIFVHIQNTLVNALISKIGTLEQKKKYLPLLTQSVAGSFCLSESYSGTDAFSLKTVAKKEGNEYIINGSKMWISNSDIAEVFIVMANANPSAVSIHTI